MSNIKWTGLAALATPIFLVVGIFWFKVRAKYIHIVIRSDTCPISRQNQKYESCYEVEEYGCVSLLATVLGPIFCMAAVTSFVVLLYRIVVFGIIPLLPETFSVVAIINGILLVIAFVLLLVTAVLSFLKDLFNPPR